MPSTRALVVTGAALAAGAAAALCVPVLALEVDEAAVPPVAALGPLPDGATVTGSRHGCGSGGCWLDVDVAGAELASRIPEGESCAARSLVDLRRVCTSVSGAGAGTVTVTLRYARWTDG